MAFRLQDGRQLPYDILFVWLVYLHNQLRHPRAGLTQCGDVCRELELPCAVVVSVNIRFGTR